MSDFTDRPVSQSDLVHREPSEFTRGHVAGYNAALAATERRDRYICAALTGLLAHSEDAFDAPGAASMAVRYADAALSAADAGRGMP